MSLLDLEGNAAVDHLANQIAKRDRAPKEQLREVRRAGERLTAIATWIGQIGAYANEFADPRVVQVPGAKAKLVRDSTGMSPKQQFSRRGVKRKAGAMAVATPLLGDLSQCPRWAALRQRILAKATVAS